MRACVCDQLSAAEFLGRGLNALCCWFTKMSEIIEREEVGCVRDLEEGVKNKWRWSWLEIKDENGDYLSEYIRKIRQPGKAICVWCGEKQIRCIRYTVGFGGHLGKCGIKAPFFPLI